MKTPRGQLLFVFAVQVVLCRGLLIGELPYRRDLSRLFVPLKHYLSTALRAGWFPQWWPFDGLGMPLASQPTASLFHPTTALFALLPFGAAFALQFFLPLPFALLGTYRLGRALGLRAWSATLAGAVYSLSGYFLSMTEFTFSSLAAAALPFVAWGAVSRRGGVLAVSMALLLLAGDPVLAYLAVGTALMLGWRRAPLRRHLFLLPALGWAGLAAAIQWLPTALLYFESSRSHGTVHGSTFWAMGPQQLLGLLLPREPEGPAHLLGSTYVGVITLALACLGAASRGRSRGALLLIAFLSLALAVGDLLPLWKAFATLVPGWSAFRFPAKVIAPFVLVVALLAGRGAQRLLRRRAWAPLLLGVVTLELALVNGFLVETAPTSLRDPPPLATTLRSLGVSLEGATYAYRWAPPSPPRQRLEDDARQLATLAPSSAAVHGLPSSNAYLPGYSSEYGELSLREQWTWLGNLSPVFGTRYLVATAKDPGEVKAIDEQTGVTVLELPGALPRAYLTTGVQRLKRALVPAYLRSPNFQPGKEVVLEGEGSSAPAGVMAPAAVHRVGDSVEVTATAEGSAVLVLNEALFAGVRAFEGARELQVLRANHVVRGVALEPGPHVIRFTFETPGLTLGASLSALALALGLLATRRRLTPAAR